MNTIESIIDKGGIAVNLKGVERYTVLRTVAELFKADIPACVIDFPADNMDYTASFTRLLCDRFGPDIVVFAGNIHDMKTLRIAKKSGVRGVIISGGNNRMVKYAHRKKMAVVVRDNFSDCSLADAFSRENQYGKPIWGEDIKEITEPIITPDILKNEDYEEIRKNAEKALNK